MIELGKAYQTRDGRAVRVLATDFKAGATCVIGAITMTDTNEIVGLWNARGEEFGGFDHLDDLIPVPTKHEGWILVDCTDASNPKMAGDIHDTVYTSKEHAEQMGVVLRNNDSVYGRGVHQYIPAHVTWED